jgi:hypothetical protein
MSNASRTAAAVAYAPPLFEPKSVQVFESNAPSAPQVSAPSVLLIGRSVSWGVVAVKYLAKFDSKLSFAAPENVSSRLISNSKFRLILLDASVTAEQRRGIMSELAGTGADVYYSFPVENGCWWLPAMRDGQNCHGAPAFRRDEFAKELEKILGPHHE